MNKTKTRWCDALKRHGRKYTRARDCAHAGNMEGLVASVRLKPTCPLYDTQTLHLSPIYICRKCEFYVRRKGK